MAQIVNSIDVINSFNSALNFNVNVGVKKRTGNLPRVPRKIINRFGGSAREIGGRKSKVNTLELARTFEKLNKVFSRPIKADKDNGIKDAISSLFTAYLNDDDIDIRSFENAFIAQIRNPILRNRYGRNSPAWVREKGFDRLFIDTGNFFDSIDAEVERG